MKKLMGLIALIPLFIITSVFAQSPKYNPFSNSMCLWSVRLGDEDVAYFNTKLAINENGECFVTAGERKSSKNVYVEKYDSSGKKLWAKSYGGSDDDSSDAIIALKDGGCIVGAGAYSRNGDLTSNNGKCDYWVFRLDKDGKIVWQKSLGDGGCDFLGNLALSNDDKSVAFCGMSYGVNGTYATFYKLSIENGKIEKEQQYGNGAQDYWTKAKKIETTIDGGFVIVGQTDSYEGMFAGRDKKYGECAVFWIMKIDGNGKLVWQQFCGEADCGMAGIDVSETAEGDFLCLSEKYSYDSDDFSRYMLLKFDSSGNFLWIKDTNSNAKYGNYFCLTKDWAMESGADYYGGQIFDSNGNKIFDFSLTGAETWSGYDIFSNPFAYSEKTNSYAYASSCDNHDYSQDTNDDITIYFNKMITSENRQKYLDTDYRVVKNRSPETIDTILIESEKISSNFLLNFSVGTSAKYIGNLQILDNNGNSCASNIAYINIEDGIEMIFDSFNDCPNIKTITIPPSVEHITNSFGSLHEEDVTIYGTPGSAAQTFARQHDFKFEALISVKLNGKMLLFDRQPLIYDGRTLVPMRTIFEEMDALVEWDKITQTASARKGNTTIVMQIDSGTMQKNNDNVMLDVPAQLVDGRTMIPVRAIAEAFGAKVEWDKNTNSVIITQE